MSNEQKVWLSFPGSYCVTNIYSIGMNIPGLYDFPALQENRLKLFKNMQDEKLRKRHKKLGAYLSQIGYMMKNFQKFPTLPDSLWIENENEDLPKPNEYVFRVQGGFVFKEACANIFKRFNLGNSTLTPIQIYRPNKELWRDETYYFLNLCEKREFVRKQQNHERLEYTEHSSGKWEYVHKSVGLNVDYVEIDKSAIDCDVDLWHDPRLVYDSYFLSDALYSALLEAGFADAWAAGSCKLV